MCPGDAIIDGRLKKMTRSCGPCVSAILSDFHPAYLILTLQHHASHRPTPPMHIAWCTTLFILGLASVAGALRSGKWCPRACDLTLGYATFNDTDPWLSRKVRQCRSQLRITSLYLCFDEFCILNDGEVFKRIAEDSEWCDEHAGVTLPPFHDVVDYWTPEDRARLPRHSAEKAVQWPVLNTAVLPEERFFERAFTTLVGSVHQNNSTEC